MSIRLMFLPPTLPNLVSGDGFVVQMAGANPELRTDDAALVALAAEMNDYSRLHGEYDNRTVHYSEWIQWFNNNPTGKEQLLTFLTDHRKYFDSACQALEKIDAAITGVAKLINTDLLREQIRQMREHSSANARVLADNINVASAAESPQAADQAGAKTSGPKIQPQKRTRPEKAST